MDVFSRWVGEIINEIDMYFYYFNMFDISIENKKIYNYCMLYCKDEKKILYGCFVKIVFDLNNIVI